MGLGKSFPFLCLYGDTRDYSRGRYTSTANFMYAEKDCKILTIYID